MTCDQCYKDFIQSLTICYTSCSVPLPNCLVCSSGDKTTKAVCTFCGVGFKVVSGACVSIPKCADGCVCPDGDGVCKSCMKGYYNKPPGTSISCHPCG